MTNELLNQDWQSSDILISNGYYRQGVILTWIALRRFIFQYLTSCEISFSSTREALLKFILIHKNEDISSKIWFLESISTLCEWGDDYLVEENQAIEFKYISANIINILQNNHE